MEFHQKEETLIIALGRINSIIIEKIASTIDDRLTFVDLNATHHMAGVPKDDIGPLVD
jgi:hypothetical protein